MWDFVSDAGCVGSRMWCKLCGESYVMRVVWGKLCGGVARDVVCVWWGK